MTSLHLRARARSLVRVADFSLTALFWATVIFIAVFGTILSLAIFKVKQALGVAFFAGELLLLALLWNKKNSIKGLLEKADGLVDGTASRLTELLQSLVEEALSSAALSFSILPGILVATSVVLAVLKYGKLAFVLFSLAVVVSLMAACMYSIVRHYSLREIEHVVKSLIDGDVNKDKSKENVPLLDGKNRG